MSAIQQRELCLSKCTRIYKIDVDNQLHNCACGALSIVLRLRWLTRYLQNHCRKEWLSAIALMILHRDVKINYEKLV